MPRPQRSLRRIWRDRKPFVRRIRWYENDNMSGLTKASMPFRLEFTDEFSQINRFFSTREVAEHWMERFITLSDERPFKQVPGASFGTPSGENVGDSPVHRIEVEIKQANAEGT